MKLSRYGSRYIGRSGIVDLMQDLGSALRENPAMLMMGGGTPARIPAADALYRTHLQAILADPEQSHALLGRYQAPLGDLAPRAALADMLRVEYGWQLGPDNIAITNGGQSAFGMLANMLAGPDAEGNARVLRFPLVPEYLGYSDIGHASPFFRADKPRIDLLPDGLFKYRVDFDKLHLGADSAALCASRPTNPSGNVLGDAEVARLDALAREQGIPLILDCAYGQPFPALEYGATTPYWSDNTVLLLSLSKVGLPGLRSGFLIGNETLVRAFAAVNTIFNLASGNPGPMLAARLLRSGELLQLSRQVLRPWYQERLTLALDCLRTALDDVPCHIHRPDGAYFLWLWFPGLPGGSQALYQSLKAAGVLVIPGDSCFPGIDSDWAHTQECIRLSYAIPEQQLRAAAAIIARVVRETYAQDA